MDEVLTGKHPPGDSKLMADVLNAGTPCGTEAPGTPRVVAALERILDDVRRIRDRVCAAAPDAGGKGPAVVLGQGEYTTTMGGAERPGATQGYWEKMTSDIASRVVAAYTKSKTMRCWGSTLVPLFHTQYKARVLWVAKRNPDGSLAYVVRGEYRIQDVELSSVVLFDDAALYAALMISEGVGSCEINLEKWLVVTGNVFNNVVDVLAELLATSPAFVAEAREMYLDNAVDAIDAAREAAREVKNGN